MNTTETNFQHNSIQAQLISLAKKLQQPVSTLKALTDATNHQPFLTSERQTQTLLENSRTIIDLVENITTAYTKEPLPLIFELYHTLPYIQACCTMRPDPTLISKTDLHWLVKLEHTVLIEINKRKINLIDLADELAVSERQLHRNIKKFVGLTPNHYIRMLKLHQAKEYLENYEFRTIAEVSHAVGFRDPHYFTRIFFHQYGISPKAIRAVS